MRIKRQSAAEAIVLALRGEITSGTIPPLARLIEADLAERLSVSRTPLREALQQLETDGFLERLPSGGLIVTGLDSKDVGDLFWLRAILEKAVVEDVTRRATEEQIDHLTAVVDGMDAMRAHPDRFLAFGRQFHEDLADLFGNARCRAILEHARLHVDRYWAVTTARRPERTSLATTQHRDILAAMRERNATAAGERMKAHILAEAEVCLETVRAIEADL